MSTKRKGVKLSSYWRVWLRLLSLQFETQIANSRGAAVLFILSKLFRLATAFLFVYVIVGQAKMLAGYTLSQAIFILALFNWISTSTQLFFRGVYMFRDRVSNGTFDFYLLNPLNELFYSLFSYTDPLDLILMFPYTGIVIWAWVATDAPFTILSILLLIFCIFLISVIVFSLHVCIIAIGVMYLEVDNTIMLYRDLEKMAAFPVDIYGKYLGSALTYVLPFALLATVPAKLIFGMLNPAILTIFTVIAILYLYLSLKFWNHALKSYSSASS